MRVFISSTCYDLIDLRAEIADFFRQAGAEPILSDCIDSQFQVDAENHSIGSCLANVRNSDAFVIVLSQRYGPSLKKVGFEDCSATHLEYLEARQNGIPIHMYVRDKLDADYSTWKANDFNDSVKLPWLKKENRNILKLLKAHTDLIETARQSNWCWVFRDSAELKRRLAHDFRLTIAQKTAQRLSDLGRVPFLEITGAHHDTFGNFLTINLDILNLSNVPALSPVFSITTPPDQNAFTLPSIDAHAKQKKSIRVTYLAGSGFTLQTRFTYSILEGYNFEDLGVLSISIVDSRIQVRHVLSKRRYMGIAPESLIEMASL